MRFLSFKDIKSNKNFVGIYSKNKDYIFALKDLRLKNSYPNIQILIETLTLEDRNKIRNFIENENYENVPSFKKEEIKILPPFERTIHDIICAGLNYQDHINEVVRSDSYKKVTSVYFSKRATKIIGHEGFIDGHLDLDHGLDYEVELAIVIGKEGKKISIEEAEDYIFGYTIMNDISARTLQRQYKQWFIGKSLDTFTSLGPVIVTPDELPLPLNLQIKSVVNGEIRQHSNTNLMIRNVAEIIHEISQGITLEPGDIIATGTCSGVGLGFDPPKFMKSGDVVECYIENIGSLINKVK